MVCPGRATLNRNATIDGLLLPHRSHPSRAAGSFFGPIRTSRGICRNDCSWRICDMATRSGHVRTCLKSGRLSCRRF